RAQEEEGVKPAREARKTQASGAAEAFQVGAALGGGTGLPRPAEPARAGRALGAVMAKRKEGSFPIPASNKRLRQEDRYDSDDEGEPSLLQSESNANSQLVSGEVGIIERIQLKNFMCHSMLGPFNFGSNINFILGNNGSGKSAILTALIVGLGGKAIVTNRGSSLKDFVKDGQSSADVSITLRNRGDDAFKPECYGDSITINQHISVEGHRSYKLKSSTGVLVSSKKEELTAILDHFNIQVDNPISVLTQEMSKLFLQSKNEADKYKFFMKATQLEQMKEDYSHIMETKARTHDQIAQGEEVVQGLVHPGPKRDPVPPSTTCCDDFAKHFKEKIAQIRHELDSTSDSEPLGEVPMLPCGPKLMDEFQLLQPEDVDKVLGQVRPTTCLLDPCPSWLLNKAKHGIGTWILEVVSASLRDGRVPAPLKEVVVRPVLKKASLDPEMVTRYRPVANILFLGKVLEYGTESALVALYDDLCRERDRGSVSLLVLLDLSAAFDTIDHGEAVAVLNQCLAEVMGWMKANKLKLNPDKMEILLVGGSGFGVGDLDLVLNGVALPLKDRVCSLGVLLDPELSLEAQVTAGARSAFPQLRLIHQLRPYLENDCLVTVTHALVTSRLDFCNLLYVGLPLKVVRILQMVQNRPARLLTGTGRCADITPVLRQLHWLPIEVRAQFKVLVITYKALNGLGPGYLKERLRPCLPSRPLRSAAEALLREPSVKDIRRFLEELKKQYLVKEERYKSIAAMSEMQNELKVLQHQIAWAMVRDTEKEIKTIRDDIAAQEARTAKFVEKVKEWQDKVNVAEVEHTAMQDKLQKITEEAQTLQPSCNASKTEIKTKRKAYNDAEVC
ncbi:Structural maintenance of chromosomes protein 6, partial [Varanus komodoensis]